MPATGITASSECIQEHNEMRMKKKHGFLIFKINDEKTEIVIDKFGETGSKFADFAKELPPNECRYGVFPLSFEIPGEGIRIKNLFVLWAPETAKVPQKMLYASTAQAFKTQLPDLQATLEVHSPDQLTFDNAVDHVKKYLHL